MSTRQWLEVVGGALALTFALLAMAALLSVCDPAGVNAHQAAGQ